MALKQRLKGLYDRFDNIFDNKNMEFSSIKSFYKELCDLFNCNQLQENEVKHLVDCCLLFVEYVVTFVNINKQFDRKHIEILQKCLEILEEFSKITRLKDHYIAHIIIPLLEFVSRNNIKKWLSKELLKNVMVVLKDSNEQLRFGLGRSNTKYLFKVLGKIRTAEDFELQLLIIEVIFSMLSDESLKTHAHLLFPEHYELQTAFFEIARNNLFYSIRKFLNSLNLKFNNVIPIKVGYALMDSDPLQPLESLDGKLELWVDFNICCKTLSIPCSKKSFSSNKLLEYDNDLKIVTIFFEDVNIVKMSKLSKNETECLILFQLNTPCVILPSQSIVKSDLKLVLFDQSYIDALETVLLPQLFKQKFEKVVFTSQTSEEDSKETQKPVSKRNITKHQSLNVKKAAGSFKITGNQASSSASGTLCLKTKLGNRKKSSKKLLNSTKPVFSKTANKDHNIKVAQNDQEVTPFKITVRLPKVSIKRTDLQVNKFDVKNNTFESVFDADFENLPYSKKTNKLSLCNFNNVNATQVYIKDCTKHTSSKDESNKPEISVKLSSSNSFECTTNKNTPDDQLISKEKNKQNKDLILPKITDNIPPTCELLTDKCVDINDQNDKEQRLSKIPMSFKTKVQKTTFREEIEDALAFSKLTLSFSRDKLKSSEFLKSKSNQMEKEDTIENKLLSFKMSASKSKQLQLVMSEGNLIGFSNNLKFNKDVTVIDDILEISDDDDDNLIEKNNNVSSRNGRNILTKSDSSKSKLIHMAEEDTFEKKLFSSKMSENSFQQETPVKSERDLFDFGISRICSNDQHFNKCFTVIDNIIEISDDDDNNLIENNVNISSRSIKQKEKNLLKFGTGSIVSNQKINTEERRKEVKEILLRCNLETSADSYNTVTRKNAEDKKTKHNDVNQLSALSKIDKISFCKKRNDLESVSSESNIFLFENTVKKDCEHRTSQTKNRISEKADTASISSPLNSGITTHLNGFAASYNTHPNTPLTTEIKKFSSNLSKSKVSASSFTKTSSVQTVINGSNRMDDVVHKRKNDRVILCKEGSVEFEQEVKCALKSQKDSEEVRNMKVSLCKKLNIIDEDFSNNSDCLELNNIDKGLHVNDREIDDEENAHNLKETITTVTRAKSQDIKQNLSLTNVYKELIDKRNKISFCNKHDYVELENENSGNIFDDCVLSENLSYSLINDITVFNESARVSENDLCCDNADSNAHLGRASHKNSSDNLQNTKNVNLSSDLTLKTDSNKLEFENHSVYKVNSNTNIIINKDTDKDDVLHDNSAFDYNRDNHVLPQLQEVLQESYSQSIFSSMNSTEELVISQGNNSSNEIIVNGYLANTKICNNSLEFVEDTLLQVSSNECINSNTQCNSKLKTTLNVGSEVALNNNNEVINRTISDIDMAPDVITDNGLLSTELNNCTGNHSVSKMLVKETFAIEKGILTQSSIEDHYISKIPVKKTLTILTQNNLEEDVFENISPVAVISRVESNNISSDQITKSTKILKKKIPEKTKTEEKSFKEVSVLIEFAAQEAVKEFRQMRSTKNAVHVKNVLENKKITNGHNTNKDYEQLKENNQNNAVLNEFGAEDNSHFDNKTSKDNVDKMFSSIIEDDSNLTPSKLNSFNKLHEEFKKTKQKVTNNTSTHSKINSTYSTKRFKRSNAVIENSIIVKEPGLITNNDSINKSREDSHTSPQNSNSNQIRNNIFPERFKSLINNTTSSQYSTKSFNKNCDSLTAISQLSNEPAKKKTRFDDTFLSSDVKRKSANNSSLLSKQLFIQKTTYQHAKKSKRINILQNLVIDLGKSKRFKSSSVNRRTLNVKNKSNSSNYFRIQKKSKSGKTVDEVISSIENNRKFNLLIESLCKQMKIRHADGKQKEMEIAHYSDKELLRRPIKRSSTWKTFDKFSNNRKRETTKDDLLLQDVLQEDNFDQNLKNNYEELNKLIMECSKSGNSHGAKKVVSFIDAVLPKHKDTYISLQEAFSVLKSKQPNDNLLNVLDHLIGTLNKHLLKK